MKKRLLFIFFAALFLQSMQAQVTTVGVIGSATPGGWDVDTDMTQDATDTSIWTLNIDLVDGEAKFRANDDWAINWGFSDFPTGFGEQDGPNIPVVAGNYDIVFNRTTGEYSFTVDSPLGIIGSATPGGWDEDSNMFYDEAGGFFYTTLDLVAGEAKFRANDDWAINWGAADFPSGIGTQDGPNIPIDLAGKYYITLDTSSGAYNFEEQVSYASVGIIGDATAGGWDMDTDMNRSTDDPNAWSLFLELADGEVKFRADDDWAVSWGSPDFPVGTGVVGGDNIPVTAGFYKVDFNSETGDYVFTNVGDFNSVGIIGDATPGGWDADTDMTQDADDPTLWTMAVELTDGEAKFRADDDWAVNWGGADFPVGVAVQDGANIPIEAGEYNVTFNTLTGEYSFEAFVIFDQVSLVGEAGPTGAWPEPDDMGAQDTYLDRSDVDDQMWSRAGVTLADAGDGGGVKFRANTDWAVNWGAEDFPAGVGTQGGANILSVAGTYDISFNSQSGEYAFMPPSGTEEILTAEDVVIFPSPARDMISIDISALNITGTASIKVVDMSGRVMTSYTTDLQNVMNVSLDNLSTGQYFIQIGNDQFIVAKRFMVAK